MRATTEVSVTTKYIGPRGARGARITVVWEGRGQKTFPYDYGANSAHESAVYRAAQHFGVSKFTVVQGHPDQHPKRGYWFCVTERV